MTMLNNTPTAKMVDCALAALELDDVLPLHAELVPLALPFAQEGPAPKAPAVFVAVASAILPVSTPAPWLLLGLKYNNTAVLLGAWSLVWSWSPSSAVWQTHLPRRSNPQSLP